MKKSTKVFFIIASILIALGLVLTTVGIATGGFRQVVKWAVNGDMNWNFTKGLAPVYNIHFDDKNEILFGNIQETVVNDKDNIQKIAVEIGGGTLVIKETSGDEIKLSSVNANKFQYFVSDDTLVIRQKSDISLNTGGTITLLIPGDMEFEFIDLSIGGGILKADKLKSDKVKLEVGAGKIDFDFLQAKELEVSVGAGEIKMNDSNVEDVNMEVGMGHINYKGSITGDLLAECAMGSVEFDLKGHEEDYNYKTSCSMGNIQIGSNSYTGLAMDRAIQNGADSTFTLECAMGNIQVKFR